MNLVQEITDVVGAAPESLLQGAFILQINPHRFDVDPLTGARPDNAMQEWLTARGLHENLPAEVFQEYVRRNTLYVVYLRDKDVNSMGQTVCVGYDEWNLLNNLRAAVDRAKQGGAQ